MEMREVFPDHGQIAGLFARVGVDPDGVAVMTPKTRFRFFFIRGLKTPAANILKQEALSYGLEAAVSIGVINCSVKQTDALLWGDERRLGLLAEKLRGQVYGLGNLSDLLRAALCEKPARWVVRGRELPPGKTLVMGILNLTPDSFHDGGRYESVESAVEHGVRMARQGAAILDLGGESTRPGSDPVPPDEELRRVMPVLSALRAELGDEVFISVDTRKALVASASADAGADIINDVSGLGFDPDMAGVVAKHGLGLVIMHAKGTPKDMQDNPSYEDTVGEIHDFLGQRLSSAVESGIAPEAVALDPGIGFGKRVRDNLLIIKNLREFRTFGRPVVLGHSRKRFIGHILGLDSPDDRLIGSLSVATVAALAGVDVIRTHDVPETVQAVRMAEAIANPEGFGP